MDPYKVLQVDPEAEDEVIQAAYRRLAQKYHPDVVGPDGAARMASINAAWELLRDPSRRAAHDRERRAAAATATAPGPSVEPSPPDESVRREPDRGRRHSRAPSRRDRLERLDQRPIRRGQWLRPE